MRTLLFGGVLVMAAAATGAVIGAQQTPKQHPLPQICQGVNAPDHGEDATSHHAAFLAAKLDLTAPQRVTIERVSAEACAAIAKYHEDILGVLSTEQRAMLHQLHQHESGIHAWFRKLHGGR